jgi:acyl-[acyl carrier protein]--UDP-N-acetylglucosamine O-acyltransferase
VRAILERGVEKHIKNDVTPYVIVIQKHVRAYLARLNLGELYDGIVRRRKVLKEEIRVRKIQKHFRKHFYMEKILRKQKAVDKFIGMIKFHRFYTWYKNIRKG